MTRPDFSSRSATQSLSFPPTVLYPFTPITLLRYILTTLSPGCPTTLLVCSSRSEFLKLVLGSIEASQSADDTTLEPFLVPTLYNLFSSRHVTVVFCVSLQSLLAYLSTYSGHGPITVDTRPDEASWERLFLVNPLALHASTSAFCAQGLSRTISGAVEASLRVRARLIIVECLGALAGQLLANSDDEEAISRDTPEDGSQSSTERDPWAQELPILSISARRFGPAKSDRSWAGRKVTAKRVVSRWCHFQAHQNEPRTLEGKDN